MPRKSVLLDKKDIELLYFISSHKDIVIYDLAKQIDLAYNNLLLRIKTYTEKGWITRKEGINTENRKIVQLNITEKGLKVIYPHIDKPIYLRK